MAVDPIIGSEIAEKLFELKFQEAKEPSGKYESKLRVLLESYYLKEKSTIQKHFDLLDKIKSADQNSMPALLEQKKLSDIVMHEIMGDCFDFMNNTPINPEASKLRNDAK
jgi:hypothetical protein